MASELAVSCPVQCLSIEFLCIDVLLEIVKYLSWPDAINAFSIGILLLLRDTHTKIHLSDPSHRFFQMIQQHCDPSRIASLRVTDDFRAAGEDFSLFRTFDQLVSLTVFSQRHTSAPTCLLYYLPNVRFVFLFLDGDINCFDFRILTHQLCSGSTTRLELRCPAVRCGHTSVRDWMEHYMQNKMIMSVVFDLGLIKMLDDGDYTREATNIEWDLRRVRPRMIFQIKTA